MDYLAIQTELQEVVDDTSTGTLSTLKKFINDFYREVNARWDWPFTEARALLDLTSGTRTVSLAAVSPAVVKIRNVSVKGSTAANQQFRVIDPIEREHYEAYEDEITTGVPMKWSFEDGNLTLALLPIPSYTLASGLRVLYNKRLDDLSANGDTPAWPAEYHQVLVDGAAARWFDREDDLRGPLYQRYAERGRDPRNGLGGLQQMVHQLMNRHSQGISKVQFLEG